MISFAIHGENAVLPRIAGLGMAHPKNSLAAIQHALDIKACIVNIDVRQSADGVLFLMHDDTLARMMGVDVDPETLDLGQSKTFSLRKMRAG